MEETGFEFSCGVWSQVRPRLGERRSGAVPILWRPTQRLGRRRQRRAMKLNAAMMEDVSVTGGRLLLSTDTVITTGAPIDIQLDGAWTVARVAWIRNADHPAGNACGVVFRQADAKFLEAILRAMNDPLTGANPTRWGPPALLHCAGQSPLQHQMHQKSRHEEAQDASLEAGSPGPREAPRERSGHGRR